MNFYRLRVKNVTAPVFIVTEIAATRLRTGDEIITTPDFGNTLLNRYFSHMEKVSVFEREGSLRNGQWELVRTCRDVEDPKPMDRNMTDRSMVKKKRG